jgi:hypothetical protein
MNSLVKTINKVIIWVLLIAFISFYPMLISIYVFLPLLVGVMGYLFMRGIETNKISYVLVALVYFMNLEANLALPFFLTTITTLFVYAVFYRHLNYFRKCTYCRPILSVILIDFIYLGTLLSYDFVFQTNSIVLDNILIYSLVVDLLVVVLV